MVYLAYAAVAPATSHVPTIRDRRRGFFRFLMISYAWIGSAACQTVLGRFGCCAAPKNWGVGPICLPTQLSTAASCSPSTRGNSKNDKIMSAAHRRWEQCSSAAYDSCTTFFFEIPKSKRSVAPADLYCFTGVCVLREWRRLRHDITVDTLVGGVLRECRWHLRPKLPSAGVCCTG